ncbi:MAG: LysM peptidoglycan-binding domain-containing protein [Ilumatobacteraceae bacterium]|nr:LysM peptidoglycan-binding domain-containing protein [Ilumatobacteraceae bacterium]
MRTRGSSFRIDPFVSRVVLILVAFALVVPVAWSTRRTADDTSAISRSQAALVTSVSGDIAPNELNELASTATSQLPSVAPSSLPESSNPEVSTEEPTERVSTKVATTVKSETLTSAPVTNTSAAPSTLTCGSSYVVRAGDSWTLIADRASIPTRTLLEHNEAAARDTLYPADELCLPQGVRVVIPATTIAPSTTSAPPITAAPTTTVAIPPSPSNSEIERIIRAIWPDDLEERALKIAWRESNYQADADNGWCCVGLFQIYWTVHQTWLRSIGVTSRDQLFAAEVNTRAALTLYERSLTERGDGWDPWCYGSYLQTDACAGL